MKKITLLLLITKTYANDYARDTIIRALSEVPKIKKTRKNAGKYAIRKVSNVTGMERKTIIIMGGVVSTAYRGKISTGKLVKDISLDGRWSYKPSVNHKFGGNTRANVGLKRRGDVWDFYQNTQYNSDKNEGKVELKFIAPF